MFGWWNREQKKILAPRSLFEIKQIARILVIDDRRPQLVADLENEGWHVRYLPDLDKYENTELLDSHIICLDIVGIGQHLRCGDGMGLVQGIKEKYPQKRILLYSSVREHNIFDSAIDSVDCRVFKDGQPYQFIKAVEQLGFQAFDWKHCVEFIYERHKAQLGREMSFSEFEKSFTKCIDARGQLDVERIAKFALVGLDVATKMAQLASFVGLP